MKNAHRHTQSVAYTQISKLWCIVRWHTVSISCIVFTAIDVCVVWFRYMFHVSCLGVCCWYFFCRARVGVSVGLLRITGPYRCHSQVYLFIPKCYQYSKNSWIIKNFAIFLIFPKLSNYYSLENPNWFSNCFLMFTCKHAYFLPEKISIGLEIISIGLVQ